MPFKETCAMEERIAMFREYDSGAFGVSDLARRYGISRETFYQWKRRRESSDTDWFRDRPSLPGPCSHQTEAWIADAVKAMKRRFPSFGPKKGKRVFAALLPRAG